MGRTLRICELYKSIQGEGTLTGVESIFVRTSGCNLRCTFCDTPFSSWQPEGRQWTITRIVNQCLDLDCQHVVLTGGEPMLQKQTVQLTRELKRNGLHITIETAGTVDRPVECDLMSISPKLTNSTPTKERAGHWMQRHETNRDKPDVVQALMDRYDYQLKFVADQPADCDEILEYLNRFSRIDPNRVLLMPQGTRQTSLEEREPWIQSFCDRHGFKLCRRMHIVWFGNKRGT